MTFYDLVALSVIQGITEFLPISSTAHLIILPHLFGFEKHGLDLDIAVHLGSLAAVSLYFWRDVGSLISGSRDVVCGRFSSDQARLLRNLTIATGPVMIIGYIFHSLSPEFMRSLSVMTATTFVFGGALFFADRQGATEKKIHDLSWPQAFVVGLWQCCALIPGTSRSGACITGLRMMGYAREDAAHFSCLMSLPVILGASCLMVANHLKTEGMVISYEMSLGAVLSFLTSFISLYALMRWLKTRNYTPFVIYRLILGCVLLLYL